MVGLAGDGGTFDIGLQALSGAAERNEDILYVCLDNEGYMNTGIQRSGATPFGAWTTTTPVGTKVEGKREFKKDLMAIIAAHDPPYAASLSIAHYNDFIKKVEKAKGKKGFRFLHVMTPCVPGWRSDPSMTVEIARLAVETGTIGLLWEGEAPDDFERIKGIGKVFEQRLYDAGIRTYRALASATVDELAAVSQGNSPVRPDYAGWIAQAQKLLVGI